MIAGYAPHPSQPGPQWLRCTSEPRMLISPSSDASGVKPYLAKNPRISGPQRSEIVRAPCDSA